MCWFTESTAHDRCSFLAAVVLPSASAVGGGFAPHGRVLEVKGLAEREVTADLAVAACVRRKRQLIDGLQAKIPEATNFRPSSRTASTHSGASAESSSLGLLPNQSGSAGSRAILIDQESSATARGASATPARVELVAAGGLSKARVKPTRDDRALRQTRKQIEEAGEPGLAAEFDALPSAVEPRDDSGRSWRVGRRDRAVLASGCRRSFWSPQLQELDKFATHGFTFCPNTRTRTGNRNQFSQH